jgi:GTP-binding protein
MSSNARPRIAIYHFTTLQPILGVVDLEDAPGFVMADIPGLIEGAADGAGLGHEFLAHLERTRILIHVVDAAGSEGRDPIEDIMAINRELARYKIDLSSRKQIIAANKCDLIQEPEEAGEKNPIDEIRAYCEPLGIEVFPISAATGQGVKDLLYHCSSVLAQMPSDIMTYEQEYDPELELAEDTDPFTVSYDAKAKEYIVEGPRIERMLGYTNLESEKGFVFFQKFLVDNGIIDELKRLGCKEGDFVRLYGHGFEFYD